MANISFDDFLNDRLNDPQERKLFEEANVKFEVGYQLYQARQKANLSRQQLAQKVGLSANDIGQIERGEEVPLKTLQQVANGLDLKLTWNLESIIS
ncbi:helix-turn-helix domain-containing protein [Levilactobacillus acidifarinae]|uniref:HTH cro/C1-type domain-containing protein n=1 Tax=Levilactobacillus acidifarinae DSM 19394 = JCM 15949 TaxID=1423715 RepID=A0A0R1LG23_9LACO|nr:helix-turn-helix domain-containing protein [Levilactobacillus acidifarinae]KRK94432.1 hypothetical protein FD25_GL000393 [Levilactobacillus acidifarinae DSM 19394]GEO68175.1 hypothetical protein LAC03_00850 [Levilactobacillus acidifarinae]